MPKMNLIVEIHGIQENAETVINTLLHEIDITWPKAKTVYSIDQGAETHIIKVGLNGYEGLFDKFSVSLDEAITPKAEVIKKLLELADSDNPPKITVGPLQYAHYKNVIL